MNKHMIYQPYIGSEPYIFLRYDQRDNLAASALVNRLMDKQFRVCYCEHDGEAMEDTEWVASRILASQLVVFLITGKATKSLAYRNAINYALYVKKPLLCVYLDDEEPDAGIAMQLSSVPGIRLSDHQSIDELCERAVLTDSFVQELRGEDAKIPIQSKRKKRIAITLMAVIVTLFLVSAAAIAVYRIHYANTLPGQIEQITEAAYLDISNEDASVIKLLKDKTIQTLVARNITGLTDIEPLQYVTCETLDIADNPNINTLEPLLENKSLQTVIVTQDMYPAIARVSGRTAFKMIISE